MASAAAASSGPSRRSVAGKPSLLVVVGVGCVGTALWQLSVPAFPDTYRRSTVPYLTVSIAGWPVITARS